MLSLSMSIFFIPVTRSLVSASACEPGESASALTPAITCHSSTHVAVTVVGFTTSVAFAVMVAVTALLAVDRNPLSLSWQARVHGRVDAAVLAARYILVITASAYGTLGLPVVLTIGALAALIEVRWCFGGMGGGAEAA
jgi:hypothetical protein